MSPEQQRQAARALYNMSFDGCVAALSNHPNDVAFPVCQAIRADKEGRRDEARALIALAKQNEQVHEAQASAAERARTLDALILLYGIQQQQQQPTMTTTNCQPFGNGINCTTW